VSDNLKEALIKWEAATLWSAATSCRFGLRRLDAGAGTDSILSWPRQVATGQSADRSAHSKELPLSL